MTVILIYATFILLVIVLLIVNIYFINEIIRKRNFNKKLEKNLLEIDPIIKRHLSYKDINKIDKKEINNLMTMVLSRKGLESFNIWCSDYIKKNGFTQEFKNYIDLIIDYKVLLGNRIVRERYKNSYILYLLSLYKIDTKEAFEYAFSLLDDKSLYARNNALRVIQNSKDETDIMKALNTINETEHYFNNKIIIDFITEFSGDKSAFHTLLIKNFEGFDTDMKKIFIEYFTNIGEEDSKVSGHMFNILKNSEILELVIAATKYFGEVINTEAKKLILKNLDSEFWELRAVSGKVIEYYKDEVIVERLEAKLTDSNWYVRYNSALSLINITNGKERDRMLKISDGFAREIYIYALFTKGIIDINEYQKLSKNIVDQKKSKDVINQKGKIFAEQVAV